MSGGVDSSAAAGLLLEQGYDVVGVTFRLWKPQDEWPDLFANKVKDDIADARKVCDHLGIPHHVIDMREEFKRDVIENFVSEYQAGRTPSPCIVCNQKIKFGLFYEKAKELGADFISTGHYARIDQDKTGIWQLKTSFYPEKDQSYFLYHIPYDRLPHILFPLGNYTKPQVREIAEKFGFEHVSRKKDSQEICFIEDGDDYKAFLRRNGCDLPKGDFVDADGNILGEHQGILHYTIGQRKGLGIALGKPAFVTGIDSEKNQVVLGDNQDLFKTEVVSDGNILLGIDFSQLAQQEREARQADCGEDGETRSLGIIGFDDMSGITAKIRYAAKPAAASLKLLPDGKILATFEEPQRAPTPGQSIVFYRNDLVLGGGFIV